MCLFDCHSIASKAATGIGYKIMKAYGYRVFRGLDAGYYFFYGTGIWYQKEPHLVEIKSKTPDDNYPSGFHIYLDPTELFPWYYSSCPNIADYAIVRVKYRKAHTFGTQLFRQSETDDKHISCIVADEMMIEAVWNGTWIETGICNKDSLFLQATLTFSVREGLRVCA